MLTQLYFGDQIRMNEVGRTCGMFRGEEGCIQGLVGKPERRRLLERRRHRWDDHIKMDLKGTGCKGVAQEKEKGLDVVNMIMNHRAL